jgi:uncharacterized NAD(P)/FAD-binding protein YdhS
MTRNIAIVGGGISGTLVVLNCLRQSQVPLEISWFDKTNAFCKGFAYSTLQPGHLLNVRAANMSLFPDETEHFVNWLAAIYPAYTAKDFVPRKLFGEYALHTWEALKDTNPIVKVTQYGQEVTAIEKTEQGFRVSAAQIHNCGQVVLALGNFLPAHPRSQDRQFVTAANYFQNAFHPGLPTAAASQKQVTIIGSGLTMIDTVISLTDNGYKGHITVISPHAYLPQAHHENPLPPVSAFISEDMHYTLSGLYAIVNAGLKKARSLNLNPHSVIDVMRPHLQQLWCRLSLEDKQQFLRHLRHKWGVARHRAPAQSMAVIERLMAEQRLSVVKGRIFNVKTVADGFELSYFDHKNAEKALDTGLLINCTGPESNPEKLDFPLIKQLLKDGLIAPDKLKYGLNAATDGTISKNIYTLGPPLKGILWESTAVPEIRVQAQKLAAKIISD